MVIAAERLPPSTAIANAALTPGCAPHLAVRAESYDRIIVLACSSAKRADPGLLPAIDRYDGGAFRVLRRYLRECPSDDLGVLVLSAEFELISGSQMIPQYDRRLSLERAREIQPRVEAALAAAMGPLGSHSHRHLFVHASRLYLMALGGVDRLSPMAASMQVVAGPPGIRLAQLKRWLHGEHDGNPRNDAVALPHDAKVPRIAGQTVRLNCDEALAIARRELERATPTDLHAGTWYVLIDGRAVEAKWLASQLSGLGPSEFRTSDSRRFLRQLGFLSRPHGSGLSEELSL